MDAHLLPELSGETWVASALLEEFTADLLPAGTNVDLIAASRQDATFGDGTGVDSVGIYSGMGGVCRTFSVATLLAVASGQLVHRQGWAVMSAPGTAGGGLSTGGSSE